MGLQQVQRQIKDGKMIKFTSGEILNPTSLVKNAYGRVVYANQILIGGAAWTAGFGNYLGRGVL